MKEFASHTGGRYTYIDDIINLQELALAFSSIFSGCDNFIISGCQVAGNSISAGYVYINGKIRYCAGVSSATKWPMYLYESNYTEKIPYADSSDKVGRNVYGCAIASSVPITNDALTGAPPQSISIAEDGSANRLQDALFGKYSLLLNPSRVSQIVEKPVSFNDMVNANGGVSAKNNINIIRGVAKASINYNASGALTIQSVLNGNKTHKLVITEDGEFQFYANNVLLGAINANGTSLKVAISTDITKGGNLVMTNSHLYNGGYASDEAAVNINMWGYNGGAKYYRDTIIGDGKNRVIMSITGKTKDVIFNGAVNISYAKTALTLSHPTLSKTDKTLTSYCLWRDKNGDEMAVMGYINNTDLNWHIKNNIGHIQIDNDMYVTGSLYVKGTNILSSLVSNSTFNTEINKKANASDVYLKTEADKRYIKLTDSINVFVDQAGGGDEGMAAVRSAIGASSIADFKETLHLNQSFHDIVSYGLPASSESNYATLLESRKRTLCNTLGAAFYVDIDKRYIKRSDSISVFVDNAGGGVVGKEEVCNTIGACTTAAFADAVLKSKGFQDIVSYGLPNTNDGSYSAKLAERKRALCTAIGAAYASDLGIPPKDTGWITMSVQNCGITTALYVRQVGHVVSIQGELHTHHSGTIFTLPNSIDPPKYEIGYSHNRSGSWHCVIKGGSRDCKVDYCNGGCSEYIGFLMTYIV